jgi:hypothetical protein
MARHPNYYRLIIKKLISLYKTHPSYNIGRHISTALDGHTDIWGVSDKEFLYALQKYETNLNMDVEHEEDIEDIIKDGMNLDKLFLNEEEED